MQKIVHFLSFFCLLGGISLSAYGQTNYVSEEKAAAAFDAAREKLKVVAPEVQKTEEERAREARKADVEEVALQEIVNDDQEKETSGNATTLVSMEEDLETILRKIDANHPTEEETLRQDFTVKSTHTDALVPLNEAPVRVDIEHKTLSQVLDIIINQARPVAGDWNVKWRLSAENNYLKKEEVNLTAETHFGEFVEFLVDRINNMTGIQLFVTVFNQSRIIVISDTYY